MPAPEEIAYRESVRALEGQAQDLASIRSHVSLVLSAGGIAAAFLGAQSDTRGPAFWVAVGAFAGIAAITILVHRPVELAWDFDGYALVNEFVDPNPQPDASFVMRELAVHAAEGQRANKAILDRLWRRQSIAFLVFGVEVVALLANIALE